ncbi:MAG: hypothetical protein WBD22_07695 [Pyrinomonadaceae bacterium]
MTNSEGNKLRQLEGGELLLIVVLDPKCMACEVSKDFIGNIREYSEKINIDYQAVAFVPIDQSIDQKNYAESFGFQDFYQWDQDVDIPSSLTRIVTPSHILVITDGSVIHVWPGTNSDGDVRKIMGKQIGDDLNLIRDTLIAANVTTR